LTKRFIHGMKFFAARSLLIPLGALVAYTLLTLILLLPLPLHPSHQLLATDSNAINDTFFSVWIFGWQAHQLIADPLNLFQGNIFYPFQNSLAFSEIILPGALLYLPFGLATSNPVLAYNLVLLLSFPLNAFAMYLLALDWLKRTEDIGSRTKNNRSSSVVLRPSSVAAFIAGLIFAFCTYKMGELRHIQLLMAMFMPLTLMYAARFVRVPNFHNAFLTALFFALNALSSLYYAVFLAFAVALYLVVDFLIRRYRITPQHLLFGTFALVLAGILVAPFILPFLRLENQYNFSAGRDPSLFSARPASYLAAPASQWLYGNVTRAFYVASKGQPLFLGITTVLLALVGGIILLHQKNRAWIFPVLLALVGIILSFGPILITGRDAISVLPFHLPYYFVSLVVSPLKSLNAPSRFVVLTMLALALLAAYGIFTVMQRWQRFSLIIAAICALLILLEYIPAPLHLTNVDAAAQISPAYHFLAQQPRGEPVVELPMGQPNFGDQDKYVVYTYNSLYHLQPLVNGYSTFIPPDYYALVKVQQNFPSNRAIKSLAKWGAQWLVIHSDRYQNALQMRAELDVNPNIEHVQDFKDIWLYRIRR
jgi:hypothetical protein